MRSIKPELPKEYQDFISREGARVTDPNHPTVAKIRDAIKNLHGKEEYRAKAKRILRQLMSDYVEYMKKGLDAEKIALLEKCLAQP